ncbi:MAG: hypothetical protein ACI9D5_002480 [Candidatus Endobugula sp.]|jgi:hypothetical protein
MTYSRRGAFRTSPRTKSGRSFHPGGISLAGIVPTMPFLGLLHYTDFLEMMPKNSGTSASNNIETTNCGLKISCIE